MMMTTAPTHPIPDLEDSDDYKALVKSYVEMRKKDGAWLAILEFTLGTGQTVMVVAPRNLVKQFSGGAGETSDFTCKLIGRPRHEIQGFLNDLYKTVVQFLSTHPQGVSMVAQLPPLSDALNIKSLIINDMLLITSAGEVTYSYAK